MGGVVRQGLLVARGPFDKLRANGFAVRAFDGVKGTRWGMETPPAAPRWNPACEGMTRGGECGAARDGDAPRLPLPWIPAFAGTTMGVWGSASAAGGWG